MFFGKRDDKFASCPGVMVRCPGRYKTQYRIMKHFVLALITTLIFIALVAGMSGPETRDGKAKNTIPVRSEPVSLISGDDGGAMGYGQKAVRSDSTVKTTENPAVEKETKRKGSTVKKPVTKYC